MKANSDTSDFSHCQHPLFLRIPLACTRKLGNVHAYVIARNAKARQYIGGIATYAIQHGLRDDGPPLSLRGVIP
jgi:hypothetical protein